jgi:tripartite-type tricarboxylate transporter receptor subunit TctC
VPADTLEDFVRYARAKRDVPFASNGIGSYNHLATELLQSKAQMQLLHVPYKGAAEVMHAVAAGQVQFAAGDLAGVTPYLQSGRVKALALASPGRVAGYEAIPTVIESGFPELQVDVWYALFGPAKMPAGQVDRLHGAVAKVMAQPDVQQRLAAVGTIARIETPAQLRDRVHKENVRWRDVVRNAGIE